ncbi:MAG TPA: hypothetical protein DCY56_00630 [Candidatus Omnitrophica bacterium]|nr:hypothetical protein [Candidatus Omnitrophota bacterium]
MVIRFLPVLCVFLLYGCADIKVPTTHYAFTHPLSTKTMVSMGASKDEVIEKWGEPSQIKNLGYDDIGLKKEAWIYNAWFHNAPLDFRHFSRKKCIYFTGDYVTGFKDIEEGDGI